MVMGDPRSEEESFLIFLENALGLSLEFDEKR